MTYSWILFPAFLMIAIFVVLIPTIIIAVYLPLYKSYINKVLNKSEHRTQMVSPHKVVIVSTFAVLFVGIVLSLFVGYKTAQNYYEESIGELSATDLETYYAEVIEVGENRITVEGLSINEEQYQGEFQYEIWGEVSLVQGNEQITLSDLKQGDLISIILITGDGQKKGSTDVFKITLIDDKN